MSSSLFLSGDESSGSSEVLVQSTTDQYSGSSMHQGHVEKSADDIKEAQKAGESANVNNDNKESSSSNDSSSLGNKLDELKGSGADESSDAWDQSNNNDKDDINTNNNGTKQDPEHSLGFNGIFEVSEEIAIGKLLKSDQSQSTNAEASLKNEAVEEANTVTQKTNSYQYTKTNIAVENEESRSKPSFADESLSIAHQNKGPGIEEKTLEKKGAARGRKRRQSNGNEPRSGKMKTLSKSLQIDMNFPVGEVGTDTKYTRSTIINQQQKGSENNKKRSESFEEKQASLSPHGNSLNNVIKEICSLQAEINLDKIFNGDEDDDGEGQDDGENEQIGKEYVETLKKINSQHYDQPNAADVNFIKRTVLSKLTRNSLVPIDKPLPLILNVAGLYDPDQNTNFLKNSLLGRYSDVYSMLEHGILNGPSSSCLLIGSKKSGKKLVLENALRNLHEKYNTGKNKTFMTIYLSGLLQMDDKMAVREVARQLDVNLTKFGKASGQFGKFYQDEDDVAREVVANLLDEDEISSYAGEYVEDEDEVVSVDPDDERDDANAGKAFQKRSINETFMAILASLEQINFGDSGSEQKSVGLIFIIDEFEKFALHNRQTLLYNLFDLSSNNHTIPISVIGLTTKVNIKDQLEKRVSSRFSQRIISFFGHVALKTFTSKGMLINYHLNSEVEYFWLDLRYNLCLNLDDIQNPQLKNKKYALVWNDYINNLFYREEFSPNFKELVLKNFMTIKNHKELLNAFIYPLTKVTVDAPYPLDEHFAKYNEVNNFNHFSATSNILRTLLNNSLSFLQLLLVVCSARVVHKLDINFVNFNLCYEEYRKVTKSLNDKRRTQFSMNVRKKSVALVKDDSVSFGAKTWSRTACLSAWEKLEELGLIIAPSNPSVRSFTLYYKRNVSGGGAGAPAGGASGAGMSGFDNYDSKFFQMEIDLSDLSALIEKSHLLKEFTRI